MIDLTIFADFSARIGVVVPNYDACNHLTKDTIPQADILMNDIDFAFEERAAILEYDGGYCRLEAERLARLEIYGQEQLAA